MAKSKKTKPKVETPKVEEKLEVTLVEDTLEEKECSNGTCECGNEKSERLPLVKQREEAFEKAIDLLKEEMEGTGDIFEVLGLMIDDVAEMRYAEDATHFKALKKEVKKTIRNVVKFLWKVKFSSFSTKAPIRK